MTPIDRLGQLLSVAPTDPGFDQQVVKLVINANPQYLRRQHERKGQL